MTPTIEEAVKRAKMCGAVTLGDQTYFNGLEWRDSIRLVLNGDQLQAFAQHYIEVGRNKQRESDARICEGRIGGAIKPTEWWSGFKEALKQCATSIRNNTGE